MCTATQWQLMTRPHICTGDTRYTAFQTSSHNQVLHAYYMHIHLYKTLYLEKKQIFIYSESPPAPAPNLGTELKHQANQFKTKHLVTLSHVSVWGQVWAFDILRSKSSGVVTAVRFEGCFGTPPSHDFPSRFAGQLWNCSSLSSCFC